MARVERHSYSSGREFFLVVCEECASVINSGHHFTSEAVAQDWADEHNAERHAAVVA